jgi:hypothetical protein
VLYKKQLQNSNDAFINPPFIDKRVPNIVGNQFLDWLAVLHFNVELNRARQIRIGSPVEDALTKGNKEALKDLSEIIGFQDVCENVIEEKLEDWLETEQNVIANAALALDELDIHMNIDFSGIWTRLYNAVGKRQSWNGIDEKTGNGLVAIMLHCPNSNYEEIASQIIEILANNSPAGITQIEEDEEKDISYTQKEMDDWVKCSLSVINSVLEAGHGNIIKQQFQVLGDPQVYIYVILALSKDDRKSKFVEYFVPEAEIKDIVDALSRVCGDGKFTEEYVKCIELLLQVPGDCDLPPRN